MKTSMLYLTAAVLLCGCGQFMKGLSARAEQGDADALYQLGKCYKHGDGVEMNRKESAKWLRMAAENGHGDAPYCLNYVLRQLEAKE